MSVRVCVSTTCLCVYMKRWMHISRNKRRLSVCRCVRKCVCVYSGWVTLRQSVGTWALCWQGVFFCSGQAASSCFLLLTAALYPLADTFTTKSDSFIQNCITYTVYTERFGLVGGVDEGHPCIQNFDHTCTARSLASVPGFCSLCFYLFHHLHFLSSHLTLRWETKQSTSLLLRLVKKTTNWFRSGW